MASFIQTCLNKYTSKAKGRKTEKPSDKPQIPNNKRAGDFCKSVSDPALNLIVKATNSKNSEICESVRRREKSFSVSADEHVLKLKLEPVEFQNQESDPNPCDLVAHLDDKNEERNMGSQNNEEMTSSYFDDNGNEVDEDELGAGAAEIIQGDPDQPKEIDLCPGQEHEHEEPICFINAAALSEEEELDFPNMPIAKVNNDQEKEVNRVPPVDFQFQYNGSATMVRPRVPISKSFPDIIQTTMADTQQHFIQDFNHGHEKEYQSILPRDISGVESLAADSLEDLQPCSIGNLEKRSSLSIFNKMSTPAELDAAIALTESFAAGISGEKPPESWVIDFNSLSLENLENSESSDSNTKPHRSSNPNSLSFFVKMDKDDPGTDNDSLSESLTSNSEKKKIFSMFVDIGSSNNEATPQAHAPVNKPVKNIMTESCCSSSSHGHTSHTHPIRSPTTTTPMGTDMKKSIRYAPSTNSRLPSNRLQQQQQQQPPNKGTTRTSASGPDSANNLDNILQRQQQSDPGAAMSVSNRSSLHVPNETENSIITSSLLSSMETTLQEEMEICQGGPCFKLGMDLLRMFQEEINTDVNISVRGRWVRAHKCILASRSQYFAAILSGNWVERAGNTINLDEFSYNVVQFTMYHIYSGTNEIPDTIDLIELASLTDLLGLEGLREVISQTIRTKFCHNFHRPCTGCISGILECFPLAINYGMEDLHRKMTKWICKHFVRVWPTKAFANLGDELVEKCLRYSVNHLSPENLLDITLGCDQLLSTMPTVRWTEVIFSVVNQLSEACVQYVGENLSQVLQSQRFILFGKGQSWNISRIESTFLGGILLLKADEACLSHVALTRLIELGTETIDEVEWSTSFVDFLKLLRKEVEKFIMANASRCVLSKNWEYLGPDVRKRICSTSFLGLDKFGNKIQKGGPKTVQANLKNSPVASSKAQSQTPRPLSSSSSVSSRRSTTTTTMSRPTTADIEPAAAVAAVTTPDKEGDNYGISSGDARGMKSVASVRPMPASLAQRQTQNVFSERKVSPNVTRTGQGQTGSPMAARMPAQRPVQPTATALRSREREREREKSFDSSPRTSSSSSTLSRPGQGQAPMTPSRATGVNSQFPPVTRNARMLNRQPPAPAAPVKPPFMTNSEKAKAVSKPQLQGVRSGRSNSLSAGNGGLNASTYTRQSSVGSGIGSAATAGPATSTLATPRTPNLSQPSRYATTTRGALNPKPSSPLPTPKSQRNPNVRKTGNLSATTATTATRLNPNGIKSTAPGMRNNKRGSPNIPTSDYTSTTSGQNSGQITNYVFGVGATGQNSDGLMTKSSIEMETSTSNGEPKMRTLAEIGRSSTFSKDEPTILGKMDISLDGSGYNHF